MQTTITTQWKFLPDSISCALKDVAQMKAYKKGSYLYHMGEAPKGLFFVFNGLVGLYNSTEAGNDHLLRIFGAGQCLGHRSLMAQENYHAGAKLLEEAEIGFVSSESTYKLLQENHDFALMMMKKLAVELGRAEHRLAANTDQQVAERVAEAMLYLKETYPEHKWTRNEIAHYCGSTGPTVIRTLANFEKRGFIEQNGREIKIMAPQALKKFANLLE